MLRVTMKSNTERPVLVVLHQENSTPGRVGLAMEQRGYRLDVRRPRFGDPLPKTLDQHAGAIVFGGPMSANDNEVYLKDEIDWMAVPLSEGAPLLGLCLGAQLLVRHLGGTVWRHDKGNVEIGWFPLKPTVAGRRLFDWPDVVHQFHNEGFDVPRGADLLALGDSDTFPNQAIAYGPSALGIQFHVELTDSMLKRWTSSIGDKVNLPGGCAPAHHFQGRELHDSKTQVFMNALLDRWLASDARN
jgi:GMP synthase (glutamine-hydrolysing)